jgi:Fic-DOC domain mobile mystery protein B
MPETTNDDGKTPLTADELTDLIPSLSTKEELNEWERENIIEGREWAERDRTPATEMLSDGYIRKLHLKMFDQTWKWAGQYRKTEKNIGVPVHRIREELVILLGDAKYWIEHDTYSADEIALRFHHRLIQVCPFPNGNGRHARLIADVLAMKRGRPVFSWGAADLVKTGEARSHYLRAIRAADAGDIQPLLIFARS